MGSRPPAEPAGCGGRWLTDGRLPLAAAAAAASLTRVCPTRTPAHSSTHHTHPPSRTPTPLLLPQLTGADLSSKAWVEELRTPLEAKVAEERREYEAAVAAGPALKPGEEPDLDMRVLLVHGDETVADSGEGGLAAALAKYKAWLEQKWPAATA